MEERENKGLGKAKKELGKEKVENKKRKDTLRGYEPEAKEAGMKKKQ